MAAAGGEVKEQEELGGKGKEDEKRRGRPTNAELRMRESLGALGVRTGSLENLWSKRRRELGEEGEEGRMQKRSAGGVGQAAGSGEGRVEFLLMELMREIREIRDEMAKDREEKREENAKLEKRLEEEKAERSRLERRLEMMEERGGKVDKELKRIGDAVAERGMVSGQGRTLVGGEEKRLRRLELKQDMVERERKRENVIIRGVKVEECDIKEVVKDLWGKMGVDMEGVKEVYRVGKVGREGIGMLVVKMKGMEEKKRVMEAKRNLRGRRERIEDDLTVEERKSRWLIEREAERERREGRNVQVGYMKMWVNGSLWRWDEVEGGWRGQQGNGQGGKSGDGGRENME